MVLLIVSFLGIIFFFFVNLTILSRFLQQIVEFGHGLSLNGIHDVAAAQVVGIGMPEDGETAEKEDVPDGPSAGTR